MFVPVLRALALVGQVSCRTNGVAFEYAGKAALKVYDGCKYVEDKSVAGEQYCKEYRIKTGKSGVVKTVEAKVIAS